MSKAKSAHYSKIIAQHSGDHRSLWKAFNKILHHCPNTHLPDHSSIVALANTFSSFFIRSSFSFDSHSRVLHPPDTRKVLQNLSCVTADVVRHLVLWTPCKSSDVDLIPTSLVKDCIDILITPITSIIDFYRSLKVPSLHTLSLPTSLPPPLLKKPSISKDSMNNYWTVSNLSFLSEVLEKVVVNQLNSHINSSNTSNQYQSAYRKFHLTKPALLKIHNDILASLDAGKVTALTMLDLSAAFDAIGHTIFLRRDLMISLGLPGVHSTGLNWI